MFGAFLHVVVRPKIVEASPDGVVHVVVQQCGQVRRSTHSNHTMHNFGSCALWVHLCLCIVISNNNSSTTAGRDKRTASKGVSSVCVFPCDSWHAAVQVQSIIPARDRTCVSDVQQVRLRHLCRTAGASSARVGEARGGRVAAPLTPRIS